MPHYFTLGQIPHKRHTQFRRPDGKLYSEQLFSTEGFSNDYTLLYHTHPPTAVIRTEEPVDVSPRAATDNILKHRSFMGFHTAPAAEYLDSRKIVLFNNDCQLSFAAPQGGLGEDIFL